MNKKIDPTELDFLLRFPVVPNVTSPVDFLSNNSWGGIKALSAMEQFRNLDRDIEVNTVGRYMCLYMTDEPACTLCCSLIQRDSVLCSTFTCIVVLCMYVIQGSAKRWKKFVDSECPEKEKFPQEWKNKNSLQKLCMMRAFRPDRMTNAVTLVPLNQYAVIQIN